MDPFREYYEAHRAVVSARRSDNLARHHETVNWHADDPEGNALRAALRRDAIEDLRRAEERFAQAQARAAKEIGK